LKEKNKRKLLINKTVRSFLIALFIFAFLLTGIIYIFLFILMPAGESPLVFDPTNELFVVKSLIILYVLFFGIVCFFAGYIYSQEKIMGIFHRMNRLCKEIMEGKSTKKLSFREKDSFKFFAETFNDMVGILKKGESHKVDEEDKEE